MTGTLVDTNVLLDIAKADPLWSLWSRQRLEEQVKRGRPFVNPIIYAELAPAFRRETDLDGWLDDSGFVCATLPYAAGWLAAQAFLRYRKGGGLRHTPLPDFFIGAHAEFDNLTLVTRDAARFRTYFPSVTLITPS